MSASGISASALRWLRLPIRRTHPGKLLLHEFKRVLELMSPAVTTRGLTSVTAPRWYLITGMHDCVSRELLQHSGFDRILPATLRRNNTVMSEDAHNHDWYVSADTCLLSLPRGERNTTLSRTLLQFLPALQRKAALSGLVITVSADTLCDIAPGNLQQLRNVVQQLQQDLASLCSPALPVYLLVSGCETIDGFGEFFGTEPHAENDGLMGIAADHPNSSCPWHEKFDTLCRQIHLQTPARLQAEQNIQARRRVAGFAWQFERMRAALTTLCAEFTTARHVDTGMALRGIYFTGSSSGHGFFARAFFNALLAAARSPSRASTTHPLATYCRRHVLAMLLLPLLASTLVWAHACYSLHEKILTARNILAHEMAAPRDDTALTTTIARLVRVQQARALFSTGAKPWLAGIGMYDTTPAHRLDGAYSQLLTEQWLPALLTHILQWANDDARGYADRFDCIKASLMLLQPARRDAKFLHRWLQAGHAFDDLDRNDRRQLSRLLDDYLAQDIVPQPSQQLHAAITAQQSRLRALTPEDQIYGAWLTTSLHKNIDFKPRLGVVAPSVFDGVSGDDLVMPAMFTAEFSSTVDFPALVTNFLTAEHESWVLGQRESIDADTARSIVDNLRQRYLRDYAQAWHDFYGKLSLRQPKNDTELLQILQILSADDTSPLSRLFAMTRENTPSATEFSRYFQVVPASLQHRLSHAVGALHDAYADYSASVRTDSSEAQLNAALREFDRVASDLPAPVSNWLAALRSRYLKQQQTNQTRALHELWRAQVHAPCTSLLQGRYPFVSNSDTDVNYADFVAYFRPGGIEDSFVKQHLAAVRSDGAGASNPALHLSRDTRSMLQQGQRIRDAFFQRDERRAAFDVRVTPRAMDAQLSRYTLQDSAVSLIYSHGPRLAVRMSWPNTLDTLQTAFVTLDGKTHQREFSGSWALFRWLDGARLVPGANRSDIDATVSDGAHDIRLQLTTTARINPLDRQLLAGYQCIADL